MALPVVIFNSSTGSNTQASGCGPSTAVFGTGAASDGAGTSINLSVDAPDLSGVAADHVIFFDSPTAGQRKFAKIATVDNTTKIVTVTDAVQVSQTGIAWAIGGKRQTLSNADSLCLVDNNVGNGDWMPGWTAEFESGFTDSFGATVSLRRAGDTTNGPMTFRAAAGAATKPLFTFTATNSSGITATGSFKIIDGIEVRHTHTTKTNNTGILLGNGASGVIVRNCKVGTSGNSFFNGISGASNNHTSSSFINNDVGFCPGVGITLTSTISALFNYIHDITSHGISSANISTALIYGNILDTIGGDGVRIAVYGGTNLIAANTFYNITSDGIEITDASIALGDIETIMNNIFSVCGGYGINFSGGATAPNLAGSMFLGNNFHSCTSGNTNPDLSSTMIDTQTLDPQFTDAANGDFSIGTNLAAKAHPQTAVGLGATTSYNDIGAAQRQATAGGSGNQGISQGLHTIGNQISA